jgi:hypothetical protein
LLTRGSNAPELKAILPIKANKEITACYLDDHTELFAERQAFLYDNWGFRCSCRACSKLGRMETMMRDQPLRQYRVIRDRHVGHDNAENWQILGFMECWAKLQEGRRLVEKTQRYDEMASCWESLFHLAVGWGEQKKAIEAGLGWVDELARRGEFLEAEELQCTRNPETVEGWGKFIEVADVEVSPSLRQGLMRSLRPSPKATVKTISNPIGLR